MSHLMVVAAGTGPAGAEMKGRGHSIAISAPKSLVAQAARTGQVTKVDNVLADEGWLPNPLLPDTQAEMAVPITLEGQVVGVLDVQENEIGGLDESDANLLRSLANQMAVAIRNAHLFAEVETALAEAQAAQQHYAEQAWVKVLGAHQGAEYYYHRPGTPDLPEPIVTRFEKEMLDQSQVADTPNDSTDVSPPAVSSSLAAPIKLQDQTIGLIQLYDTEKPHQWSEQEMALVQAVVDQVAQAAENLRLFEETRERAGREQTIREITDKLRAAPTLDVLLETASRELGQRLGVPQTVLELGIDTASSLDGNGKSTKTTSGE